MKWPSAWVLVAIGLVLNIMAILVSSVVLDQLSQEVSARDEQKNANSYAIQLAWDKVETLERKREFMLLHLDQNKIVSGEIDEVLRGQLSPWVNQVVPPIQQDNLATLMTLINQAQQHERDRIDGHYLANLSITETMAELNERSARYKVFALFLQIFGLALILARDLARKR
ncbi:DNA mismatch repair protein [Vibrio sp. NTOU-M3]|uniref:DNA mismatch repair protein n=1 Tax=Vibrio sp. NTOU-M3 TaxID=3234954 RepID=UPI00349F33F4